jgi:PPOX class probable F420-dependent enzyme
VGLIDPSRPGHRRADRLLRTELIAWLATVAPGGQPQASPVWFLWDGETFLLYSRPASWKVRNIRHNPLVALHLRGTRDGSDIVTFEGRAELLDGPPANRVRAYVEKYREGMRELGMTPARFAADYSLPIRVTPTRVRVY